MHVIANFCFTRSDHASSAPARTCTMAESADQSASGTLFEIRAHPAGFLGAFATRSIPARTLVLDDAPLFTLDAPLQAYLFQRAQAGGSGGPTPVEGEEDEEQEPAKDLDDFLERHIKTMLSWKTEQQRKDFWALANTRNDLPPAYGIFATNAVQCVPFPFNSPAFVADFVTNCQWLPRSVLQV